MATLEINPSNGREGRKKKVTAECKIKCLFCPSFISSKFTRLSVPLIPVTFGDTSSPGIDRPVTKIN